jgi:hypothetical protein
VQHRRGTRLDAIGAVDLREDIGAPSDAYAMPIAMVLIQMGAYFSRELQVRQGVSLCQPGA